MKKISLMVSIFVAIIMITVNVFAAVDAKVDVKASKTDVKPGQEFEVAINLNDISVDDDGVNHITLKIDSEKIDKKSLIEVCNVVSTNNKVTINGTQLDVEDYVDGKYTEVIPDNKVIFSKNADLSDYQIDITLDKSINEKTLNLITLKCKRTDVEDTKKDGSDLYVSATVRTTKDGQVSDVKKNIENKITVVDAKEEAKPTPTPTPTATPTPVPSKATATPTPAPSTVATPTPVPSTTTPSINVSTGDVGTVSGTTNSQPSQTIQIGNDTKGTNATKDNATTAKTAIPAAGLKTYIVPATLIVGGLVYFSYKKYSEYKGI